jgi:hypothetical protein
MSFVDSWKATVAPMSIASGSCGGKRILAYVMVLRSDVAIRYTDICNPVAKSHSILPSQGNIQVPAWLYVRQLSRTGPSACI